MTYRGIRRGPPDVLRRLDREGNMDIPLALSGHRFTVMPPANLTAKIVKNAKLLVYEGAPHGLLATHKDKLNTDLLTFLQS